MVIAVNPNHGTVRPGLVLGRVGGRVLKIEKNVDIVYSAAIPLLHRSLRVRVSPPPQGPENNGKIVGNEKGATDVSKRRHVGMRDTQ